MINEAVESGANLIKASKIIQVSARTMQRYRKEKEINADRRIAAGATKIPANKLSEEERNKILNVVNQPEFANLPPNQIVPILADRGEYVGSEATMYRILRENEQLAHRGKAKAATQYKMEPIEVFAPNELWSWDITYLQSAIKGSFFYLYLIIDVYSRKIVGWEVYESESADYAAKTMALACHNEKIMGKSLILHSDNGSPMKGASMLGMLQNLGVVPSFSRPSVSNDNPFSESTFKTLKYCPKFPDKPFETVKCAREWTSKFVNWYNEIHKHSAIQFVSPGQRHRGEDVLILKERARIYEEAKCKNPSRWSKNCRNWVPVDVVTFKSLRILKNKENKTLKTG
jgi:putative transposase